jgi:hypothetical protein
VPEVAARRTLTGVGADDDGEPMKLYIPLQQKRCTMVRRRGWVCVKGDGRGSHLAVATTESKLESSALVWGCVSFEMRTL